MKVGIAGLGASSRERLSRFLATLSSTRVVFSLSEEEDVIKACLLHRPQVLLMGLEHGSSLTVALTRELIAATGVSILLMESQSNPNFALIYDILGAGAQDVARVPGESDPQGPDAWQELKNRLDTLRALIGSNRRIPRLSATNSMRVPIVAVGASTGGPQALKTLLSGLPKDFPFSIVVVQHLDPHFYEGLASWLDRATSLTVLPLLEEAWPEPGVVWVAARAEHVVYGRDFKLRFSSGRQDLVSRPSIDVLFESLAQQPDAAACGILLTGMGRDGAQGLLALRKAGVQTLAQDEASSVIYGMPRVANELGAATEVLSIDQIAPALLVLAQQRASIPELNV